MGTDIKPHVFFDRTDPQSDAHMECLGYHIGYPEGEDDRDHHGHDLNAKLGGIAEKQTVGPESAARKTL